MQSALATLRELRARVPAGSARAVPEPASSLIEDGESREVRHALAAFRLYVPRLDRDAWFAVDDKAASELVAEFRDLPMRERSPVLTFVEIPGMSGMPDELLHALWNAKIVFPGEDSRLQ